MKENDIACHHENMSQTVVGTTVSTDNSSKIIAEIHTCIIFSNRCFIKSN